MKFSFASATLAAANTIELGPYPGYAGDLTVQGSVGAYYSESRGKVYMEYRLSGVEADLCKTAPAGVGNACGIHIHEGMTCDDATQVGGHYFSVDSDPWGAITYSADKRGRAFGTQEVEVGEKLDISSRAMVVHDSTGARVACGLLPAHFFEASKPVKFSAYPGYAGDLKVTGDVGAYYSSRKEEVYMYYHLSGTEADLCETAPAGVGNACGIHIHEGMTCDDATKVGGHYFSVDSDPWGAITYSADKRGRSWGSQKVSVGSELDISGRAMVVHDSTGARVACALLPASLFQQQHSVKFSAYPGYAGDLKVTGDVSAYYSERNKEVYMKYNLGGTEATLCKTAPAGVGNACGIHVHEGNTCDDATQVGGHYFSVDADPWGAITYSSNFLGRSAGTAKVAVGAGLDISGRAMVVHDSTGARVACALLPAGFFTV